MMDNIIITLLDATWKQLLASFFFTIVKLQKPAAVTLHIHHCTQVN